SIPRPFSCAWPGADVAAISSSALSSIVGRKGHVPEVIEIEPIVRGHAREVREPVRETLYHLDQRGIALPAVARQLEVELLEVQLVAIAAAIQAKGQHHRHVQRGGE